MTFMLEHVRDQHQVKILADIVRFVEEKRKKYYKKQDNFGAK